MSDVLIRGIEMPPNVEGCEVILRIQPNGEVLDAHKIHIGVTAIPLPAGHGKCIDAGALIQKLDALADTDRNRVVRTTWANAMVEFEVIVYNAPTIVPAEGGV